MEAADTHSRFDHEKLDVYQVELQFIGWLTPLLYKVRDLAPGFHREVCDQLDRASLSSLLNTAEGNGKRQGKQRAKFFDDARGSAVECAACLDAMVAKSIVDSNSILDGKGMLLRIVSMLSRLVERFDDPCARIGEDGPVYEADGPPFPPPPSSEDRATTGDEGRG